MKNLKKISYLTNILAFFAFIVCATQMFAQPAEVENVHIVIMFAKGDHSNISAEEKATILKGFTVGIKNTSDNPELIKSSNDFIAYKLPYDNKKKYFIKLEGFNEFEFNPDEINEPQEVGKPGVNFPEKWEGISVNSKTSGKSKTIFFTIFFKGDLDDDLRK